MTIPAETPTKKKIPTVKREKKPVVTHLLFVMDESGSMQHNASDVRGGFNAYVETLKGDGNTYTLTAIKFGDTVCPLFVGIPLSEVPTIDIEHYRPGGNTALYDAIGYTLVEHKKAPGVTEKKPYGKNPVILVIMTDGFENASRTYTKEHIAEMLKERQQAGNWTVVYMGADQDAWAASADLGLAKGNVMAFSGMQYHQAFGSLASSTTTTATSGVSSRTFFVDPTKKR